MRRSLLTTVAALALFVGTANLPMASAHAASATTNGNGRFQKLTTALEQLNLSPTQKSQIKAIMNSTKIRLQTAKGVSAAGTSSQTNVKQIVAGAVKQIVAVLTPAQKVQLKGLMASKKA
jgi:Spy/CpxP family protein refolding chaperone